MHMRYIDKVQISLEAVSFNDGEGPTLEADVSLRLLPTPRVTIEISIPQGFQIPVSVATDGVFSLRFPQRGISTELIRSSLTISNLSKVVGIPVLEPIVVGPTGDAARLEFWLMNFPDFVVRGQREGNNFYERIARLVAEEWCVEIEPTEETSEALEYLKSSGGYAFTHRGRVQRLDQQSFSISGVSDVLNALHYFLSFARGVWTGPALVRGVDSNGLRVWEEWGARLCSQWSTVESWFDSRRADLLAEVFPGFWRRWKNPIWREPLGLALYWYIGSNLSAGGLEGAILLTQTALELLAWNLLVEDMQTVSKDAFNRMPSADQIRLLLSFLKIPLPIPSELGGLQRLGRGFNWVDGPSALTEIRNSIVHPGDRRRLSGINSDERFEAWSLGQWYLELALLKILEHDGYYANRLKRGRWVGDVERVPWAS